MRKSKRNPKLKLQIFRNLPSEVIIDIISRLPIRSIAICKCVFKSWRDLLRTREFADFHLSKSASGLVIGHIDFSEDFKVLEFDDDDDDDDDDLGLERHDLHFNTVTKFHSSIGLTIGLFELKSSANGLLLLCGTTVSKRDALCVCNPLSREYIKLPNDGIVSPHSGTVNSGFGVSKMTSQYKIVRIFHAIKKRRDPDTHTLLNITRSVCLVYVLGTGLWRSIAPPTPFLYDSRSTGVWFNGHIHWLVDNVDGSHCISCFDLETELFSTFSLPSLPISERFLVGLVALGGCLCVCENTLEEIVIWLMKEYGDENSWTKEFVIRKSGEYVCDCDECSEVVYPIKVFKNGDVLMAWSEIHIFYYSNKTRYFWSGRGRRGLWWYAGSGSYLKLSLTKKFPKGECKDILMLCIPEFSILLNSKQLGTMQVRWQRLFSFEKIKIRVIYFSFYFKLLREIIEHKAIEFSFPLYPLLDCLFVSMATDPPTTLSGTYIEAPLLSESLRVHDLLHKPFIKHHLDMI